MVEETKKLNALKNVAKTNKKGNVKGGNSLTKKVGVRKKAVAGKKRRKRPKVLM